MTSFWKSEDKMFLLKVFLSGFIAILVSKFISSFEPDSYKLLVGILALFCKESGVAMMIAAVLGYTVEAMSREKQAKELAEFKQEISEDVLSAVFRKIIPDSIFIEVKRSVLDQTLIKKNAFLSYELSKLEPEQISKYGLSIDEAEEILVCEITTTYRLKNLSDIPITSHEVRCGVSCDLNEKLRDHTSIYEATIGDEVLTNDELNKYISEGKGQGVKEFKKSVNIAGTKEFTVSFCSRTFKKLGDTEVWTTLMPTENMELEVGFPPSLEVGAKANHPKSLINHPKNPNVNRVKYELKHGVFPYQGITFWWHKKHQ